MGQIEIFGPSLLDPGKPLHGSPIHIIFAFRVRNYPSDAPFK